MKKNMLKTAAALVFTVSATVSCSAQEQISLPQPSKSLETTVIEALQNRRSERVFAEKQMSDQDLASLLWAANGINREDGRRTAPSAINAKDIDRYVVRADGAYLWDAKENTLKRVSDEDLRPLVAKGQDFVLQAPVSLVLVSDKSRFGNRPANFAQADAGYVSQNICLYCSAAGWACCPRASMDTEGLKKALQLSESQEPMLNNTVGYRK